MANKVICPTKKPKPSVMTIASDDNEVQILEEVPKVSNSSLQNKEFADGMIGFKAE